MKVMQINAVFGLGSTGKIVADMHALCLENGIESYVAYSTADRPDREIVNGYRIGGTLGKKMHAFLSRLSGKQGYYSRCATRRLLRYMDLVSPDIVHLHNLHSNFIHLNKLLKYLAQKDIPTVVTVHDCWLFTGGCFHYTAKGCQAWLEACAACPYRRGELPVPFFRRAKRILRDRKKYFLAIPRLTVCGVSEWTANEARRTFLSEKSVCTVYNGIDFNTFYPEKSNFRETLDVQDRFVLLGPASKWLEPVNREVLLGVSRGLPKDAVLLLFGHRGDKDISLPLNVKVLPHTSDTDELRRIYSAADVFVNCTRQDTLSLVNVEAQACGTPVVTFDNTGVRETVDGKCGFAVETGNVTALLERIEAVRQMDKGALSEQCRAFVQSKFERNQNYREFLGLYRKIHDET